MTKRNLIFTAVMFLMIGGRASAEVSIHDGDGWKASIYGFLETDIVQDSTRSFTEYMGGAAVARKGTYSGDNGRLTFSDRNTRLGFNFAAPESDGWKTRGTLEMDFLGYDPSVSTSAPTQSEQSFYGSPTLRIRHSYLATENDGWKFLAGQTWSLFGWQPYYFPTTVSVAPISGQIFQRTLMAMVMKTLSMGDDSKLQLAVSLERPTQRDSEQPNIDVGARYSFDGLRSGYSSTYSDTRLESLSIGLSGSFRKFEVADSASGTVDTSSKSPFHSTAFAADVYIPVISANDAKDAGNSLSVTGTVSKGSGIADQFPLFTGGLTGFPSGTTGVSSLTTLDAGEGGYDSNGAFHLVNFQTYSVSLQYILPTSWHSVADVGYSSLHSDNVGTFATTQYSSATSGYDTLTDYFVNYIHDFNTAFRAGLEWDWTQARYTSDQQKPVNNRVQFTALFRF